MQSLSKRPAMPHSCRSATRDLRLRPMAAPGLGRRAPERTGAHRDAPCCTAVHGRAPICTVLHRSAPFGGAPITIQAIGAYRYSRFSACRTRKKRCSEPRGCPPKARLTSSHRASRPCTLHSPLLTETHVYSRLLTSTHVYSLLFTFAACELRAANACSASGFAFCRAFPARQMCASRRVGDRINGDLRCDGMSAWIGRPPLGGPALNVAVVQD